MDYAINISHDKTFPLSRKIFLVIFNYMPAALS